MSSVQPSRKGLAAGVAYMLDKKKGSEKERNLIVSGMGTTAATIVAQNRATRERFGKTKRIDAYLGFVSFDSSELKSHRPEDWETARDIVEELIREQYGREVALLAVQNDGEGGNLHVHYAIPNVDELSGRCVDTDTMTPWRVREALTRILERHGVEDANRDAPRHATLSDSVKREAMRSAGAYVWMDDLQDRLGRIGGEEWASEAEFEDLLAAEGVDIRWGKKTCTYAFLDADGKQRRVRGSKVGDGFDVAAIREAMADTQRERAALEVEQHETQPETPAATPEEPQPEPSSHPQPLSSVAPPAVDPAPKPSASPVTPQKRTKTGLVAPDHDEAERRAQRARKTRTGLVAASDDDEAPRPLTRRDWGR